MRYSYCSDKGLEEIDVSDTGYWLVMAFMAVVVVVATGGVTAYAYFSQDRWGRPREILDEVRDTTSDTGSDAATDGRRELHDVAA